MSWKAWRPKKAILDRYNELAVNYSDERGGDGAASGRDRRAESVDLESQVEMSMDALRCPGNDADVSKLSGGEKRRVALCRLLLAQPDILLLDEPTNHLDAETVAWLEGHLQAYPGCVIMVTHDRYFLDNITGWTLELDRGRGFPMRGITHPGWSRSRNGSRSRRAMTRRVKRRCSASSSGSRRAPGAASKIQGQR